MFRRGRIKGHMTPVSERTKRTPYRGRMNETMSTPTKQTQGLPPGDDVLVTLQLDHASAPEEGIGSRILMKSANLSCAHLSVAAGVCIEDHVSTGQTVLQILAG